MSFIDTPDFDPEARKRDNARPRFYVDTVKNEAASAKEGKPVYFDREMVEILVPGDRRTLVVQIVKDEHRQRFSREYAHFKQGLEPPTDGTPLSELPGINRGQVEELAFAHVKTVEQLVNLSDDQLMKTVPMGGLGLRQKAKRWLDNAAGAQPMEKLAAENEAQAATIKQLQDQMAQMQKAVDAVTAQKAAGPNDPKA